jgi:hypothetical protein
MTPTSVLVLAAMVVLPLVSLLVDLILLETACSRRRITVLAQTAADEPIPTQLPTHCRAGEAPPAAARSHGADGDAVPASHNPQPAGP